MLPEVEKYLSEYEKNTNEFKEKRAEIRRNRSSYPSDEYYDMLNAIEDAWRNATNKTWDELKNSDNKLVAWIANNEEIGNSFREHAHYILRELPASINVLDRVARANDWCPVWNGFRSQALAAGVIEIDYNLQVSMNGGPWQNFFDISLPGRKLFTKREANDLFSKGISFFQFDTGTVNIKVQMNPADA